MDRMIIPPPLLLPEEPASLAALEEVGQVWGQQAMRQALGAAWERPERRRPATACPAGGSLAAHPAGRKPRTGETRCGPTWLPRRRGRWADGGCHHQPADVTLAADLGGGQLWPGLRDLAARCGTSWPSRPAAAGRGHRRGAPRSPETRRAVVGPLGGTVAAATQAAAAAACRSAARSPEPARPTPARLELELDGAGVGCPAASAGREVKVGVVHAGSERVGRTRRRLVDRRSVATARGGAACGQQVTAAVEAVNGFAAPVQVLLGEGASWIWRLGDDSLPAATPVLDRWHLRQARRRARRAAVPDQTERTPWSDRLEDLLEVGDGPGARAVLGELAQVAPPEALAEFAGSLTHLAPCIPDDAARRAGGQRVGSGGIEKAVDLVANRRLKGKRGMGWGRDRVEGIVALRVALLNDEWAQHIGPALTTPELPTN